MIFVPGMPSPLNIGLGAGGATTSPLLTSLVAYWKLDEATGATRADWTGRGNDLTDNAANTDQELTLKLFGASCYFYNSHYLYRAHAADVNLNGTNFTVAGHFRSLPNTDPDGTIIGKWRPGTGDKSYVIRFTNATTLEARVSSNGSADSATVTSSVIFAKNTWYSIGLIYDGTNLTLRVDETVDSVPYSAGVYAAPNARLEMAIESNGSSNRLNGLLDEWGIWKRAFDADDWTLFHNGGLGTTPPF